MSFSNIVDTDITNNAEKAANAQATADSALNNASNAGDKVDQLRNGVAYTPAEKRIFKARIENYKYRYQQLAQNPLWVYADADLKNQLGILKYDIDKISDDTTDLLSNLDETSTVTKNASSTLAYYSTYIEAWFQQIGAALARLEQKQWDSVSADMLAVDNKVTSMAEDMDAQESNVNSFVLAQSQARANLSSNFDSQLADVRKYVNSMSFSVSLHDYSSEITSVANRASMAQEGLTSLSDQLTTKLSNYATVNYVEETTSGVNRLIANTSQSLTAYTNETAAGLTKVYTDGINSVSTALTATANGLAADITNAKTSMYTDLKATAGDLTAKIGDKVSTATFNQKADEINTTVKNLQGSYTNIKQTAESIKTTVDNQQGQITQIENKAGEIDTRLTDTKSDLSAQITQKYNELTQSIGDKVSTSTYKQDKDSIQTSINNVETGYKSYTDTKAYEISTWVQSARDDAKSEIKQTADNIQLKVDGASYKNMFWIDDSGIYLAAQGDNKDKKIIIKSDKVEIDSSMGTYIAGALHAQMIQSAKIQSADESMLLDAEGKQFKLGVFQVMSDGQVYIRKGGIIVDNDDYAFHADSAGIYQRIGGVGDGNRMETYIDSHGFHQYTGGNTDSGIWIKKNRISLYVDGSDMKNTGQYDPEGIGHTGAYINPAISIGRIGAGNFIRLTSAFNDSQQAGYMTQIASDHIKLSFYGSQSGSNFKDQQNPILGGWPFYRMYLSNQRLELYRNNGQGSSWRSTLHWDYIDWHGEIKTTNNFKGKSFDKTSLLSKKTDVKALDGANALAAITNTDYATYAYSDDSDHALQYGPVIDDVNSTPQYNVDSRLLGQDSQSISQDNMINLLAAAVKELNHRLNLLSLKS